MLKCLGRRRSLVSLLSVLQASLHQLQVRHLLRELRLKVALQQRLALLQQCQVAHTANLELR